MFRSWALKPQPAIVSKNETRKSSWQLCQRTTKRREVLKASPLEFIHNHVTRDSDRWHKVSQSWHGDR